MDEETRTVHVLIRPDPRRYKIAEVDGKQFYLDKYIRRLISVDDMNDAIGRQMAGLPIFDLSPNSEILRCRAQTLRLAPALPAAWQKLGCTKPRAASATLWGFDAACHGSPPFWPAQRGAGSDWMRELDCGSHDTFGRSDACSMPSLSGEVRWNRAKQATA
jgi:hypothetical protein